MPVTSYIMDALLRKKINLLVHLAHIDGKLDQSEQDLLEKLLVDHHDHIDLTKAQAINLNDFRNISSKADILYWALKLIKVDGTIHPDEAAYCKALAVKLNYNAEVVDYFIQHDIGEAGDFKMKISHYAILSA